MKNLFDFFDFFDFAVKWRSCVLCGLAEQVRVICVISGPLYTRNQRTMHDSLGAGSRAALEEGPDQQGKIYRKVEEVKEV
jgi:hypothetical protein